jgi:spore coat protein U-like protein
VPALVAAALLGLLVVPARTRAAPPCRVTLSGGFALGTYDIFSSAPLVSSITVTLNCPASPTAQVTISKGNSSTYQPRTMLSGTQALAYNVYFDVAFSRVWGDGTDGSYPWAPGSRNATTTAWARVPAGQDVAAGSYSDTLVITVFP